jgi:hypothetical protein
MRRSKFTAWVGAMAAFMVACSPADDRTDPEPPGAAAPDVTPATTPPPVPPVPADSPGAVEPFDTTARTDIGAVVPDTAPAGP